MEKKVQEILQGQLPEGKPSENNPENSGSSDIGNAPEIGDPGEIGGNPEIGGSPDAGIPPELGGPSDRSGTTPADGNPEADGTSPSTTGGGSGSADGNASASSSPSESEEKGGLSGWWEKTKNYVTSGQILKDAAHIGKETLDFLVLDDVSGCFTGKDTDGNRVAGWERGLSCVSLIPAAKVAKLGKFADEALAFAGKLDDKLRGTSLGEGLQTAKRKAEDQFSRGKKAACGCPDDSLGSKIIAKLSKKDIRHILSRHSIESMKQQLPYLLEKKSRASIEDELRDRSFFNPNWSKEQIVTAVEIAYNKALKEGTTKGLKTYKIYGDEVTVYIENGKFKTAYGNYKFDLKYFGY